MDTPFLGQIELFPYGYAPMGWILCNGALLNIQQNSALYALLGIRFGGNGSSTFGIPNLSGAEPIPNTAFYIATQGLFPVRD